MSFDPITYINTPRYQHMRPGLERITLLMNKLGNPQHTLACVHVAGTNGKGSTCSYLASICAQAGLKTGLFTSPFIEQFEDRIQINRRNISFADLQAVTQKIKNAACEVEIEYGEHPTEFELMTAAALLHFAEQACDICIIEVGLGGRLDSTNIITPQASIITHISLDHTHVLGKTLAAIATEKAGIIKPGIPCISACQLPQAARIIERTCHAQKSALTTINPKAITNSHITQTFMRAFTFQGMSYETRLLGIYQPANAALAITAARALCEQGWPLNEQAISTGIAKTTWPGRFEVLSRKPLVIVDGAHNPEGSATLYASLQELTPARPAIYVVGMLEDKDAENILAPHLNNAAVFYTYAPANSRARTAENVANLIVTLQPKARAVACTSPEDAMRKALKQATPESVVVAFGSLYSIAAIKQSARQYTP